ncbi:MAG: hypothetical protein LBH32_04030 [Dysgonamonadaceae bacterium]|jgi:hypothetical protein|nr:hypothetical protein [Dysgonamonadaceae bacterium]
MDKKDYSKYIIIPLVWNDPIFWVRLFISISLGVWAYVENGKSILFGVTSLFTSMFLLFIYQVFRFQFVYKLKNKNTYSDLRNAVNMLGTLQSKKYYHPDLERKLTYAYSANKNLTWSFNPDDEVIESLWNDCDHLLAFTCADISAWFDSTYNFYLLNNYLRSITGTNISIPTSIRLAMCQHRNEQVFRNFINTEKQNELDFLANGDFDKLKYFTNRFYFIDHNTIKANKNLVSNMLSGHDLCGCHLHLVDSTKYDFTYDKTKYRQEQKNIKLYDFLHALQLDQLNTNGLDFAISIKKDATTTKLWILYRGTNTLEKKELEQSHIGYFKSFLHDLCYGHTVNINPFHNIESLLTTGNEPILPQNNKYVHIYKS